MSAEELAFIFIGGMGCMATAVITLYRALSKAYSDQVKDAQQERDRWQKIASDTLEALRAQGNVTDRAISAVERDRP